MAETAECHNLPLEILHLICSQFCAHCYDERLSVKFSMGSDAKRTLVALCRTSRLFRTIAQPLLYHRIPRWYRWLPLIRALQGRPDLAAGVRQLNQLRYDTGPWNDGAEFEEVKVIARGLLLERPEDPGFELVDQEDISLHNFCLEILLASFPSLQTLHMLLDAEGHYTETGLPHLAFRYRTLDIVGLPELRHLKINTECVWGYDFDNPGVLELLRAAPNLEQLVICRTRGLFNEWSAVAPMLPPLPLLRALEFYNSVFENEVGHFNMLQQMVRNSPRLEHFRMHSQGAYLGEHVGMWLPATQMLEALWPQRHVLKFLDINLTNHSLDTSTRHREFFVDGSIIAEFTALETLKLDETLVCRHREIRSSSAASCLTRIIPRRLKRLVVRLYEESGMWNDLVELGIQVAAGAFPRLEKVHVSTMRRTRARMTSKEFVMEIAQNKKKVEESFATSDVSLVFHGRSGVLVADEEEPYARGVF